MSADSRISIPNGIYDFVAVVLPGTAQQWALDPQAALLRSGVFGDTCHSENF
jgi:hypothetical protein